MQHLVNTVLAAFGMILLGFALIKWNPRKTFWNAEFDMQMDYSAMMDVINVIEPAHEEAIRRAIRDFKDHHIRFVSEEKVQPYVKKLERALMERTLEICLS